MSDSAFLAIVPFFFVGAWLAVTSLMGMFSGWFSLQAQFPDREESPLVKLRFQHGRLGRGSFYNPWGAVSYNGCLRFDVCASGLRISVWRIFGLFQRPFFVPWTDIAVVEQKLIFLRYYRLSFGKWNLGALTIRRRAFDRIAAFSPLRVG